MTSLHYDVIDIAETIKIAMKRNGNGDDAVKISTNTNTLKSILELSNDFIVDFWVRNSIASVLCFAKQIYKEGIHESQNVVNILSINSILVTVDVIRGSYVNGRTQNTIYSFFPNVSPSYEIVENLRNLMYLPVILDKISKWKQLSRTRQESSWIFVEKKYQIPLERNIITYNKWVILMCM